MKFKKKHNIKNKLIFRGYYLTIILYMSDDVPRTEWPVAVKNTFSHHSDPRYIKTFHSL